MTLVAFVSGRSPGLTTAVHALAATWPEHRRPIVAEFDPAGGSLAARHELPAEPGLTNLAAAGRRGLNPQTVLRHCRRLPSGVISLVAPVSPDRVASALAVLGAELAEALDSIPGTDVLADCGRLERRSPALDLVRAAPYAVFVVTPSLEGVAHAQARLESLALPPGRLALVTVGECPYRPEEVGAALHLPVLGALAHDPAGVARLNAGPLPRRSNLRRSASAIARDLVSVLPPVGPPIAEPLVPSPARDPGPAQTPGPALVAAPTPVLGPPTHGPGRHTDAGATPPRPRRPWRWEPGPVAGATGPTARP